MVLHKIIDDTFKEELNYGLEPTINRLFSLDKQRPGKREPVEIFLIDELFVIMCTNLH